MKRLVQLLLSMPSMRQKIVNEHPGLRMWCASALGFSQTKLPLQYTGQVLQSEHLSIDFGQSQQTGPIVQWYEHFLPLLEQEVLKYPQIDSLASALNERGVFWLPLHFHPITDRPDELHLTTSHIDGKTEGPFFAYLRAFAEAFVGVCPPPLRMYCVLELDPAALTRVLRSRRESRAA